MKQHAGDEIREIMAAMPAELIEALQAAHAEHRITEREARWWGYLQFARTDSYAGETFEIRVNGTDETVKVEFLIYTLENRAGDSRFGLVRRPWPDSGIDFRK